MNYRVDGPETPAIVCSQLQTHFLPALQRPALNRVDCTIGPGEFIVVLGLNGAGKSTLLRSWAGLVPYQKGMICINGVPLTRHSLGQIRRSVGLLFQGGALVSQLTALENVLCGYLGQRSFRQTFWGFRPSDQQRAMELLAQLGIAHLADQPTARLSGGQQQRVAIARALLPAPQILLADEPTTGLDMVVSRQIMDTLAQLHQSGITVIAVLHDLALAQEYGERALILEAGQIVYDGPCQNLASYLQPETSR